MWNISYAYPTLFILACLMTFYFSLPRLPIRRNRVFVYLMLVEAMVLVCDIFSSWADNHHPGFPLFILYISNGLYFAGFFARTEIVYSFNEAVLGIKVRENPVLCVLARIPMFLGVIAVFLNPINHWLFYIDETGYNNGPYYAVIYIVAFFYVGVALSIFIILRKRLLRRRFRYCLLLCDLLILAGLIFRIIFPTYLLMHTFCLAAILSLSVAFGNPETHLELHGTTFNGKALRDYMEENEGRLTHRCLGLTVFKYYDMRDAYGTTQMDNGLFKVGQYLATTFSKCMVFYNRKGRFVLLGPADMDLEAAAKEIERRFKLPWETDNANIYINVGFVSMDLKQHPYSSDTILATLVRALNEAGEKGGSIPVEISANQFTDTEKEKRIKRCLEAAVDSDSVEVFLQPIMDTKSGKIIGAEALSRIRDEDGNIIPPGSFIPIAEKSGRIIELGEQIFEKTCRFMKDWETGKTGLRWVNVNLSPIQLGRLDLADRFEAIVKKHEVNPELIHLEITEENIIDADFMSMQTEALCGKGFNLVLDDYGTGYSNLARIQNFPFTNIKLDKSLVWDYVETKSLIIPNMIDSFKHMGFSITAEGIESEEMAERMREVGCDFLQGFLYSKPISMDEFIEKYY